MIVRVSSAAATSSNSSTAASEVQTAAQALLDVSRSSTPVTQIIDASTGKKRKGEGISKANPSRKRGKNTSSTEATDNPVDNAATEDNTLTRGSEGGEDEPTHAATQRFPDPSGVVQNLLLGDFTKKQVAFISSQLQNATIRDQVINLLSDFLRHTMPLQPGGAPEPSVGFKLTNEVLRLLESLKVHPLSSLPSELAPTNSPFPPFFPPPLLSSSSDTKLAINPDSTQEKRAEAVEEDKKPKKARGVNEREPEPAERWVTNADVRPKGGQGPVQWTDTGVKRPKLIDSSEATLMPAVDPLPEDKLPKAYESTTNKKYDTRRSRHSIAVLGKDKYGERGLKFKNFQILRLVFDRYLSFEVYDEAFATLPPPDSIAKGDWNCRNLFIRLLRYLKNPDNTESLPEHFKPDVLERVNTYRQCHPGFLSLAETEWRHVAKLDGEESGNEELLTE